MKLRLFVSAIFIALRLSAAAAAEDPGIFPFEPAQMLAVLPSAPPDWKLLRSEADTSLGEWLQTRATRIFQAPPPPAGSSAANGPMG